MKNSHSILALSVVVAALSLFVGCVGNRTTKHPAKLIGRTLTLPTDAWQEQTIGRDTTRADYTILVYFDGQGCTDCRLKQLANWQDLINETERMKREVPVSVDFLFLFQAAPANPEISDKIKEVGLTARVVYDERGEFARRNVLPEDISYHAFLLDRDNKIVLIGAPILSHKLWARYKAKITGLNY
jgi:hypothetical protein